MTNKYRELIKSQITNEMLHAKQNSTKYIEIYLKPIKEELIEIAEKLVFDIIDFPEEKYIYTTKDGETKVWDGLKEIHNEIVRIGPVGIVEAFYKAYAVILPATNPPTLQAVVGAMRSSFKLDSVFRQLQAVEMVLMKCPYLVMDAPKGAERAYISSRIKLSAEELSVFKQQGTALPSIIRPRKVRNNFDIGYRTFKKPLIMGGKQHDKHCNLAHINRRNSVGMRLEKRIWEMVVPEFNAEPKVKKNGEWENAMDVEKRRKAWIEMMTDMPHKLAVIGSNTFYPSHRYDNRYRTYAEQHHINYQGTDFQKAIVELAKREEVQGDW